MQLEPAAMTTFHKEIVECLFFNLSVHQRSQERSSAQAERATTLLYGAEGKALCNIFCFQDFYA